MNKWIVIFLTLLSPSAFATDMTCKAECLAKGNFHNFCDKKCDDSLVLPGKQIDLRCVKTCRALGNAVSTCDQQCSN